jgi:SAM-dependent methyltransferase
MPVSDRIAEEAAFHDRQAAGRALRPIPLTFTDDEYLGHETWVRPAFEKLGEVNGLDCLDLGCGHGMASVVLARRGGRAVALDLSGGYLAEAARRARANRVEVQLVRGDAQRLPFADRSFDRIWGNAILHHLDLTAAGREVTRVLRPGGIAVFCEPWGENPLLELARRWLPYPGKERTRDEQPLRAAGLQVLRSVAPVAEVEGYQLLAMARRVLGAGALARGLEWCDARLLKRVPSLGHYCRYVVLTIRA